MLIISPIFALVKREIKIKIYFFRGRESHPRGYKKGCRAVARQPQCNSFVSRRRKRYGDRKVGTCSIFQLFAGKYIKINSAAAKRIIAALPLCEQIFLAVDRLYLIRRCGLFPSVQNKPLCPYGGVAVCSVLGS